MSDSSGEFFVALTSLDLAAGLAPPSAPVAQLSIRSKDTPLPGPSAGSGPTSTSRTVVFSADGRLVVAKRMEIQQPTCTHMDQDGT